MLTEQFHELESAMKRIGVEKSEKEENQLKYLKN